MGDIPTCYLVVIRKHTGMNAPGTGSYKMLVPTMAQLGTPRGHPEIWVWVKSGRGEAASTCSSREMGARPRTKRQGGCLAKDKTGACNEQGPGGWLGARLNMSMSAVWTSQTPSRSDQICFPYVQDDMLWISQAWKTIAGAF